MREESSFREVLLEEPAFLNLVLAAAEVFHEETFGILLGNTGSRVVVEYAIPLQKVKRSIYYAQPRDKSEQRIMEVMGSLGMGIEIIGDFHSHTQIGKDKAVTLPSPEDLATMEPGKLYILIAVNWKGREVPWRINSDGTLSGTLLDFHIKLGAYTVDDRRRPQRVPVVCPVATGFIKRRRGRK